MTILNLMFTKVFSNLHVYNILFEDSDVDCRYFKLDPASRVLSISGAGCGTASLIAFDPKTMDIVDNNLSHLALSALKMLAPRHLSYHDFYDLFGHGKSAKAKALVSQVVQDQSIPKKIKNFWTKKHRKFSKGFYNYGLNRKLLMGMARVAKLDPLWLRGLSILPVEDRVKRINEDFRDKMNHWLIRRTMNSPLQLLGLGVNFQQKSRIEQAEGMPFYRYIRSFVEKVAQTDVTHNWIVWQSLFGQFNHENILSIPPYLRPNFYEKSSTSQTRVYFHHDNLFRVLNSKTDSYWTHFNCSDAVDWMDDETQKKLLLLIHEKGKEGATVLIRSVEKSDIVTKLGLESKFELIQDISDKASLEDRSCLYQRVNFYRLKK